MIGLDIVIFGLIPAVLLMIAGGALWLQARATRAFDDQQRALHTAWSESSEHLPRAL